MVTPLNPAKWHLTARAGTVSLSPSVGNWSFPCKSHYWIDSNSVRWAGAMSAKHIAAVKAHDRRDAELLAGRRLGRAASYRRRVNEILGMRSRSSTIGCLGKVRYKAASASTATRPARDRDLSALNEAAAQRHGKRSSIRRLAL